jgi:hypothetical protein
MAETKQPNLYDLSGDGIHITYTFYPLAGPPQFHYHDTKQSHLFKDKEIRTVNTEIGTLVSVSIHLTPDSGSTSFTVLIPTVGLGQSYAQPITTIGITTLHKINIVGPALLGQTELYTVHPLRGTAYFVFT